MTALLPRTPPRPPEWDPNTERYWDERDLEAELLRTFQICHECRMCVTYCGSFPKLFDAIDAQVDRGRAEGAEHLSTDVFHQVSDHCWQCKLCYIKCPYTADEGARELLDFPRLMARERAQRARREGVPVVDQLLGEPQILGALGSGAPAKIANFVHASRLARKGMELTTGISAEFPLPPFAAEPFTRWLVKRARTKGLKAAPVPGADSSVVLFTTCYGEHHFPEVPRAAVEVLEKNGFDVIVPEAQTCCGMPNLDGGDVDRAKEKMAANVAALLPFVERGIRIVVPGPTCGYTMKNEWPLYLGTPEAHLVSDHTLDLMEFLDGLRREQRLNKDFRRGLGRVVYHAACHLRAQKIAVPGARLLSRLPDTEVRIVERCSAVDGTWGMKERFFAEGARYALRLTRALVDEAGDSDSVVMVTDCQLAGLRIHGGTGRRPLHPIVALAQAYAD